MHLERQSEVRAKHDARRGHLAMLRAVGGDGLKAGPLSLLMIWAFKLSARGRRRRPAARARSAGSGFRPRVGACSMPN